MAPDQILYCNTTGCRTAYLVKEILRTLIRRFEEEEIELTVEQYFILNILDKEDGLILQEVAEIVDRDKSAVLRHIDGLESNHFITRVTDSGDKRRKLLLVTKPGLQVLERARAIDQKLDKEMAGQIKNMEIEAFEEALSSMYQYLVSGND
ncbi:MarR family winged helix-turn-helix transcriptional regulator [Halalkalibaculum sp. DA384]|uniref:MarR family winged helix-turn-helix transcriptional regulator n=1 Tax=Halalkalibaculum sp. DA384 TaxID=3373606 RepID=UPI003753FA06